MYMYNFVIFIMAELFHSLLQSTFLRKSEFSCWKSWQMLSKFKEEYRENITCLHVDMNFIFECSTRYLTSDCSERVRYWVKHKKIKFITTSELVIFCLLYEHTNNDVFDNFLKTSDHFPKIFEDFPKLFRRLDKRLRTFFEHFPKIGKGSRS